MWDDFGSPPIPNSGICQHCGHQNPKRIGVVRCASCGLLTHSDPLAALSYKAFWQRAAGVGWVVASVVAIAAIVWLATWVEIATTQPPAP